LDRGRERRAFIREGASAGVDRDEVTTVTPGGNPSFDLSRKTWFQFDLSGLNVNLSQAVFTVVTHTQTFQHRAQLWGLNQGYAAFNANVIGTPQTNDTLQMIFSPAAVHRNHRWQFS
jgi:hypothetical protein